MLSGIILLWICYNLEVPAIIMFLAWSVTISGFIMSCVKLIAAGIKLGAKGNVK